MAFPPWDPEVFRARHRERLEEAERARRLRPLGTPWRRRLARHLFRLAEVLAPEVRWEVARGE